MQVTAREPKAGGLHAPQQISGMSIGVRLRLVLAMRLFGPTVYHEPPCLSLACLRAATPKPAIMPHVLPWVHTVRGRRRSAALPWGVRAVRPGEPWRGAIAFSLD